MSLNYKESNMKENNKDYIFRTIQSYITDPPLVLAGTGISIPAGIPGMDELAKYLKSQLEEKYYSHPTWNSVLEKLNTGCGLEEALTGINIQGELLNDIVKATWQLVTEHDIEFFNEKVIGREMQPLGELISILMSTCDNSLNIITTNYDRYIEYCCDMYNIKIDNRFQGLYLKTLTTDDIKNKNILNLFKVHGSLDTFLDIESKESVCIPLQSRIPSGFLPDIVTPGTNKYETLLTTNTCRNMLNYCDNVINQSKNYLCIGYGFNDSQIQQNIISNIKRDKPIVVVTKGLREQALALINNNAKKYAVIIESENNKTRVIIDKKEFEIDGEYWKLENFIEILR